jgi:hypothetical protein
MGIGSEYPTARTPLTIDAGSPNAANGTNSSGFWKGWLRFEAVDEGITSRSAMPEDLS